MARKKKKVQKEIAIAAIDYYLNNDCSMKDAAAEFGLTVYQFRKARETAIQERWISKETAAKIEKKSISNQDRKGYRNGRTPLYYRRQEICRDLRPLKEERMQLLFKIETAETYGDDEFIDDEFENVKARLDEVDRLIYELEQELQSISYNRKKKG